MSNSEVGLFESVIHITEGRDKRALEKSLTEALSDFIKCEALVFLRMPPNPDDGYLEVASSIPKGAFKDRLGVIPVEYGDHRISQDESIVECIDKNEVISDKKSFSVRTLFPVSANGVVIGVMDIYGYKRSEMEDKIVCGFLRIYGNFIAIINDNERDTLTGLLNRKTFDAQLSLLLSGSTENNNVSSIESERRTGKDDACYWVGLLDIDHFKSINDTFGHIFGDEVLLLFANLMLKTFRNTDLLFRYGGEEFVVVLSPTTVSDAHAVFERFRSNLELFSFPQVGRVTVSIGIVNIHEQDHSTTILEHADQALYYAKEHGRNKVCDYNELIKSGEIRAREIKVNDIDMF